ncbi:MAG: hypothetical protein ACAH88_03390 [Roseimicrobium sp.]
MSRRAKRIILALFLVLIAIPVLYVIFSWRPADALRFQACGYFPAEGQPAGVAGSRGNVEVLIENTGHFPIRYYMGYVVRDADGSGAPGSLLSGTEESTVYHVTIPPGKFIRARAKDWDPRGQSDGGIRSPGISVRHYWLSSTRAYWDDLLAWWYWKRNPGSLRFPAFHEGHAPLIPPPDSASMP